MSTEPAAEAAPRYHAYLGLRDAKLRDGSKAIEVTVGVDPDMEHNPDDPHMYVMQYIRRHWNGIIAAAEIEFRQATAEAVADRVEAKGSAVKAATLQ